MISLESLTYDNWEDISEFRTMHMGHSTKRLKVIGGWIVLNSSWDIEYKLQSDCMIFIEDKKHKWEIE